MTWYPFQPQAAVGLDGVPVQSGAGRVYALSDTLFANPLPTRTLAGASMLEVTIAQFVSQAFQVENLPEVIWKSGAAPGVQLISAKGMRDAAEAAQSAAEDAAGDVAAAGAVTDAGIAGHVQTVGSQTRTVLEADFRRLEDPPERRADLVGRFLMRRGGRIGTGGVGVVALRFDHHLNDFQSKVLPLLRQYHLPWAQVVNPDRVGVYPTDSAVSWSQLQDMALQHGGEVWNHGADHGDASTKAALRVQIVESLDDLRTNLPELAVEGWAPPGLAAGGYMGAAPFQTTDQNTGTYAGRLIMGYHAAVAGYADGLYRVLDGVSMPIGAPHVTIDAQTPSSVAAYLNAAEGLDAGIALMLHPNLLDQGGQITTSQFGEVLADIAARRAAGTLRVLSYSGLWCADATTSYRHDLAPKAARTAAAVRGPGESYTTTVAASRALAQLGATKELVVKVTTAGAGTVSLAVTGKPTTSHTLVAGENLLRRPVTVGKSSSSFDITVTPSVASTINEVHLYAV